MNSEAEPMSDERQHEIKKLLQHAAVDGGMPIDICVGIDELFAEISRSRAEVEGLRTYVEAAREPMAIYAYMYKCHACRKKIAGRECDMPAPPESP